MKNGIRSLGIIVIATIIFLFLSGCSDDNPQHPKVKTTLKIVPVTSSSRSIGRAVTPSSNDKLEFYIELFHVLEDANPRALWLIGTFDTGSKGGTVDNRGWYDVTVPNSFSVQNDFNTGKHSGIGLILNGVKFNGTSLIGEQEKIFILFTNNKDDVGQGAAGWKNDSSVKIIPWSPIAIHDDTEELIVTLSVDVDSVYDYENEGLKDDWWNGINVTTELK